MDNRCSIDSFYDKHIINHAACVRVSVRDRPSVDRGSGSKSCGAAAAGDLSATFGCCFQGVCVSFVCGCVLGRLQLLTFAGAGCGSPNGSLESFLQGVFSWLCCTQRSNANFSVR